MKESGFEVQVRLNVKNLDLRRIEVKSLSSEILMNSSQNMQLIIKLGRKNGGAWF